MRPAKAEVFLRLKIRFQAVADGFVEQNSRPSGPEDDGHLAGGCGDRFQLQDGGAGSFAGKVLRRVGAFKEIQGYPAPAAGGAAGSGAGAVVSGRILRDDKDVQARPAAGCRSQSAVGGCDQDAAKLVAEARADLGDARVEVPCSLSARWMSSSLAATSASAVAPAMG